MREALAGLTVRGRGFMAAGITSVVCAIILGQPALSRVGVLVAVLPLATAFLVGRSRYQLSLVRQVTPQVVAAGHPAQVTLTLSNEGRTPSGVLLLEDHIPYALGSRPRFTLDGIGNGWRRQVTYQVRSDVRGRFEIGPMTVRVNDPFGLVELGRAFQIAVPLTVTPRVVTLPAISLGGGWAGSGENRPRAFAIGSAEDVTVRDYRQGDDLRRVHWRSSARMGELMVRREEQPWQSRADVILDNRLLVHRGLGAASSLEAAVTATASIITHLGHRGYEVRLITAGGNECEKIWHSRDTDLSTRAMLEHLAVVDLDHRDRLDTTWLGEHAQAALTVAVLGAFTTHDLPVLRRLRHHTSAALALALDVDAWGGGGPASDAVPVLHSAGWRAASVGPRDRLESVWQELGRTGARRPHWSAS